MSTDLRHGPVMLSGGEAIWRARHLRGFSQQTLANKTGLTKRAIQFWESGKRRPTVETLRLVAKACNLVFYVNERGVGIEIAGSTFEP